MLKYLKVKKLKVNLKIIVKSQNIESALLYFKLLGNPKSAILSVQK